MNKTMYVDTTEHGHLSETGTEVSVIEASQVSSDDGIDAEPEILTFGLLKELMGDRNIPALKALVFGRDDSESIYRLEDMDKYFAHTLWSTADIELCLAEDGYAPSVENVDTVLSSGYLKYLGDCTDADWYAIHEAISFADLKKRKATEPLGKITYTKRANLKRLSAKYESEKN